MSVAFSGMGSQLIVSILFVFNALFIFTYGMELPKNGTSADINVVSRATTGRTNKDDVQGLVAIYNLNSLFLDYTIGADPCIPTPLTWIECNSDANPRVIALDLQNRFIIEIPDFSTMDALQRIDLSQTGLTGYISSFLGTFPNLIELNLNYNSFYGQIPDSIACNKKLKYSVVGNTYDLTTSSACSSSTPPNKASPSTPSYTYNPPKTRYRRRSRLPITLGSIGSIFLLISAAVGIFAIFRHKAKTAAAIAAASTPAPESGPEGTPINEKNISLEERPTNSQPTNISPGV